MPLVTPVFTLYTPNRICVPLIPKIDSLVTPIRHFDSYTHPIIQLFRQNVTLFTGKVFLLESLDALTDEFLMTWSPVGIPAVMLPSHTLEIHQS